MRSLLEEPTGMVAHAGSALTAMAGASGHSHWHVLVVDDDEAFHTAAHATLDGQSLFGRCVSVLHARSHGEAVALLKRQHGVALVVLRTGMPAEAGYGSHPVYLMRNRLGMFSTRIVLRADGREPAPDMALLLQYDISDYREAAELHGQRLLTMAAAAIRAHDQLRQRESAHYDALVQLPNRACFVDQVDDCVRRGTGDHLLALIDIDDFSAANEVMGHRFGDRLLEAVARCLADELPVQVLLARVGSDTFGVLGPVAQVDLRGLLNCVAQPLAIDGVPYKVSLTCGYVLLPGNVQAGADLVKDATIALKRAKRDHRGEHVQYHDHMGTEARARAMLLSDLRAAIDDELLFLAYQPQIDLQSGAVIGLEALLRWRTREGRFVPPDQFIPVAEASGLIVPLGRWVLFTACKTMRRLLDAGHAPLRIAVNVSMVQLRDPGFFAVVSEALAQAGLHGRHLELEITESVAVLPTAQLESTLTALRATGVSIAIDDFGTGYSSLSCLERLPLDRIKIDRSFVSQLGDAHGARIAEMVTQLGGKLGLEVLAEGIEDAATWQALLAIGCHQGQGYHVARPMDEAAVFDWLRRPPPRPTAGPAG